MVNIKTVRLNIVVAFLFNKKTNDTKLTKTDISYCKIAPSQKITVYHRSGGYIVSFKKNIWHYLN